MNKYYLKLFFYLLIFYNSTIYLLPPLILYTLGNTNIVSHYTVLLYPTLFLFILSLIYFSISRLKIKKITKFDFDYIPIEFGFIIWVIVSLILFFTNNITMSVVENNKIPFLSIFKNFNNLGIIFSILFSRAYKKNKINLKYYLLFYLLILFFTFLTLSKFLILLNIIIPFLIIVENKKWRLLLGTLFAIIFIPIYLFLTDIRSAQSAQVDLNSISDLRTDQYGFTDFVLDRLNYYQIFNRAIETKYTFNKNPYLDNFYSLIPRIFWKNKKNIGINNNNFGRDLGILDNKDENTSLGIGLITESFLTFNYFGLFILIIFGFLFYFIKFFNSEIFNVIVIINFTFLDSFSYFTGIFIYVICFTFFFKALKI